MSAISLIVGLGNPGPNYVHTRHNAGFWFVDEMAARHRANWRSESRFFGDVAKAATPAGQVWLLKPNTFMNLSGQAVLALAHFYRIAPEQILVVHDELDIPAGAAKFKQGGGNGGHNGLKDIQARLGSPEFWRLRLGIGHPGEKSQVIHWVLKKPSGEDLLKIHDAIEVGLEAMSLILAKDMAAAARQIHTQAPSRRA